MVAWKCDCDSIGSEDSGLLLGGDGGERVVVVIVVRRYEIGVEEVVLTIKNNNLLNQISSDIIFLLEQGEGDLNHMMPDFIVHDACMRRLESHDSDIAALDAAMKWLESHD